jgi:hypothetical protein
MGGGGGEAVSLQNKVFFIHLYLLNEKEREPYGVPLL